MATDRYDTVKTLLERRRTAACGRCEATRLRENAILLALPLAEHIARRYRGRGESFDDLLQAARLGLIHAVDRYDPQTGHDFLSFAVPTVMGEVRRHFRDKTVLLRIPRSSQELNTRVQAAREELERDGAAAGVGEIAQYLGTAPGRVRKAISDSRAAAVISMDERRATGSGEDGGTIAERLGVVDPSYSRVEDCLEIGAAVHGLNPREQRIIGLRFVDQKTQAEIATEIGVSQMHVSRLLRRALGHLREELTPVPLQSA